MSDIDFNVIFEENSKNVEIIKYRIIETVVDEKPETIQENTGYQRFKVTSKSDKSNICPDCSATTVIDGYYRRCTECGVEIKISKSKIQNPEDGHSMQTFRTWRVVGPNSTSFQRSLLSTCSHYPSYSRHLNSNQLHNINYKNINKALPVNVINTATELFESVRALGIVVRGNGRKGLMGACIFYACRIHEVSKMIKDIAMLLEVNEKYISNKDRMLHAYHEKGLIQLPGNMNPLQDYIKQYLPALGISVEKYGQFIVDLIARAQKKHLHIMCDSRMNTKCVGAIFMLTTRVPELKSITREAIHRVCNISKSTFVKYYHLLYDNHAVLKKVFKKHKIPMDPSWKVGTPVKKKTKASKV